MDWISVRVRIIQPAGELNGLTFVDPAHLEWQPVIYVLDPAGCEHVDTMCPDCAGGWFNDYDVEGLPEELWPPGVEYLDWPDN